MAQPQTARTLVVGDVHGCASELDDLLEACAYQPGERLIFVGDLVAKGPDSVGVIERAMSLWALSVRGNHDDAVLRARSPEKAARLKKVHREVAEQLDEPQWQWLESLPVSLRLPELNTWVVHAGVVPSVPLGQQRPEDLMHMRTLRDDGSPSSRLDDGQPWASQWPGPAHVVFGHDAVTGLQRHPYATGLDTGCVYGGRLTALILPERKLCSVPARKQYRAFA